MSTPTEFSYGTWMPLRVKELLAPESWELELLELDDAFKGVATISELHHIRDTFPDEFQQAHREWVATPRR